MSNASEKDLAPGRQYDEGANPHGSVTEESRRPGAKDSGLPTRILFVLLSLASLP